MLPLFMSSKSVLKTIDRLVVWGFCYVYRVLSFTEVWLAFSFVHCAVLPAINHNSCDTHTQLLALFRSFCCEFHLLNTVKSHTTIYISLNSPYFSWYQIFTYIHIAVNILHLRSFFIKAFT